jgi:hypothetical protein
LGFTCADAVKVDAKTPEKAKAHRVAHDIRVMLYPHKNVVDSRLYTSVTPARTHGWIELPGKQVPHRLTNRNNKAVFWSQLFPFHSDKLRVAHPARQTVLRSRTVFTNESG